MESVAGTGMKGIGAGTGAVGTITFGTIMGGAASSLAGGNFWQGAVSGMIVSTFNHVMHGDDQEDQPRPKKKAKSGVAEQNRMNLEINKKFLSIAKFFAELDTFGTAGELFEGAAILPKAKIYVSFGQNDNQIYHTFRHVEAMGLDSELVKDAVLNDIPRISKNVFYGGKTIYTQIRVAGQDIIYSAHRLENGTINVGRITGL